MAAPARVLVVGMDALDLDVARELAGRGDLPTFARLLESSAWAETATPPGLVVGSVWPSINTGVTPSRHGFYCFLQLQPGTYDVRRYTPHDIAWPAMWQVLSDAGLRCGVVDAPLSPPARDLRGVQVVDWGTHDRILDVGAVPDGLHDEIDACFGRHPIEGRCDDYAVRGAYGELRDRLVAGVERKWELSKSLLERGGWDLFVTVFGESHCAGHHFWHVRDPDHPDHDPAVLAGLGGDPLVDVYRAIDRALADALAAAGDATVLVVCSHGFGPHFDGDHLLGAVLARIEDATYPRSPMIVQRERAYRLLQRWGRRVRGTARPGYAVDGSRRFFKVPNNELYGAVRVNLVGREPRGRVHPGAEYDDLVDALVADLTDLVNDDTGEPAVTRVLRTAEIYQGERLGDLPDLLVDWNRSAAITSVSSPKIGCVQGHFPGNRTGDHRPAGLLMARGPGIEAGPIAGHVDVTDIAPTVAGLLGVDLGPVDGRPLPAVVGAVTGSALRT
jgi:predicted AlkP superfamily phosphohydrolase/phosphomutase